LHNVYRELTANYSVFLFLDDTVHHFILISMILKENYYCCRNTQLLHTLILVLFLILWKF